MTGKGRARWVMRWKPESEACAPPEMVVRVTSTQIIAKVDIAG